MAGLQDASVPTSRLVSLQVRKSQEEKRRFFSFLSSSLSALLRAVRRTCRRVSILSRALSLPLSVCLHLPSYLSRRLQGGRFWSRAFLLLLGRPSAEEEEEVFLLWQGSERKDSVGASLPFLLSVGADGRLLQGAGVFSFLFFLFLVLIQAIGFCVELFPLPMLVSPILPAVGTAALDVQNRGVSQMSLLQLKKIVSAIEEKVLARNASIFPSSPGPSGKSRARVFFFLLLLLFSERDGETRPENEEAAHGRIFSSLSLSRVSDSSFAECWSGNSAECRGHRRSCG